MARGFRGYRRGAINADPKVLKLFWDGEVSGVTWNYNRKLPDSDSRESHSINTGEIKMSTSGYYAEIQYYLQVDFTKYSKLCINVTKSTGVSGGRKVGYGTNTNLGGQFTKSVNASVTLIEIDVSSLTGLYYIKLWITSGNRVGASMNISRVWLEK